MATSDVRLHVIPEDAFLKRMLFKTDWTLVLATVSLTTIGMVMILSATLNTGHASQYLAKQSCAILIGMVVGAVLGAFNYQLFQRYWASLFLVGVMLLLAVLFFGTTFRSTKAWIHLGVFSFQPSEVVKILSILGVAGYLDHTRLNTRPMMRAVVASGMVAVVVVLLLAQPDLSAAILYVPVTFALFHVGGIERRYVGVLLSFIILATVLMLVRMYLDLSDLGTVGNVGHWIHAVLHGRPLQLTLTVAAAGGVMGICWWFMRGLRMKISPASVLLGLLTITAALCAVSFGSRVIRPHQQKRLVAFISPQVDPSDAGYSIIQTKIAIGSGGLWGKGLFQGTQTQLGFVPEKHTDFIFSLIAEETGLLGSLVTILLYVIILARGLAIMRGVGETYGILVSAGIIALFASYLIINVGMNLGITPVVGLPLPFVSYGGSNIISSYAAVGILNSIHLRKYFN